MAVGSMSLIGLVAVGMALLEVATAVEYHVGDSFGWRVPPSNSSDYYNQWASNKEFKIGDTLVFNWTGSHTAADVSEEDYNNCSKSNGYILISTPVRVNLTSNGTRHFVCTIDSHCEQGQKLKVTIGNGIAEPPASVAPRPSHVAAISTLFLSALVASSLISYCA